MLTLLLKPKFFSFKNSINGKTLLRRLPFIAIGVAFWIFFFAGTYEVLSYVRGIDYFGEFISMRLFSLTFFSLMGFLILSNIITAISSFYLSKDIPFFLSKPVMIRDVIRLKIVETCLNSSWMALSFMPPLFLAYGASYQVPISYYAVLLISFLLFTVISTGIGISIAHLLVLIFPAPRTREVLFGIGILLFLALYFILKSVIPDSLSAPENMVSALVAIKTDSPFLPSYWITRMITPMFRQEGMETFYALVLLANAAFFLVLSELIGLRLYRDNFERIQPSVKGRGRGFFQGYYPGGCITSIFYKDAKVFFRDTGQWSQIFIIGALIMVYIFNFRSIPISAISELTPYIREIMVLVNMVLAGLVLSAVAARFLYSSVSLEGRAFWVIQTSPVEIKIFLWSKFLYGCLPITILIVFLVFLTNLTLNVDGMLMLVSIGTTLMLCISVSSLGTGFGAIYPKFTYANIASVSMSLGGMAFMLIAFSLILVTLSLETWVFYIYSRKAGTLVGLHAHEKLQIAACIFLLIFINSTAFYLPMRIGEKIIRGHPGSL